MDDNGQSDREAQVAEDPHLPSEGKAAQKLIEPWERQAKETTPAWEAFKLYRDSGLVRSIRQVAKELDKSTTLIGRWSARWKWVARVEHWDREQDRVETIQLNAQRKAAALRHAELFRGLLAAVRKGILEKFGEKLEKIDGDTFEVTELIRALVDAAKGERLALGEPETVTQIQHTGARVEDGDQPIPVTFTGQLDEAMALLEVARAREAAELAQKQDQS